MENFKEKVKRLFEIKNEIRKDFKPSIHVMGKDYHDAVLNMATSSNEGKKLREELAQDIPRAIKIAYKNNVAIDYQSLPAPAIGGAIIPVNIFYAILEDTSYDGIKELWIEDKINETIGQLKRRLRKEFYQLINPFYWIYSIFVFIVRIPFYLISISGFDVRKVEDHLLSKIFKLLEILALVYILLKFGIQKTQLLEWLKVLIK
ncbi:hypothetical protein ACX8XN_08245 [Calditrichota bacterium GD2]